MLLQDGSIRLIAGNTGPGIFKDWPDQDTLIDVRHVAELRTVKQDKVKECPLPFCVFASSLSRRNSQS